MTVTIHRPVYTGTGYRATNGSGLALTLEQEVESLEQAIYDLLTEVRAVLGGPNSTLAAELLTVREAVKVPPAAQQYYSNIWDVLKPLFDFFAPLVPYEQAWSQAMQLFAEKNTPQQVDTTTTNITTIINTGVPSTALPSPPPAGYGGSTPQEVWEYPITGWPWIGGTGELNALDLLQAGGVWGLLNIGSVGIPDRRNPYFALVALNHQERWTEQGDLWTGAGYNRVPAVDWTQWDGEETLVAFLNRVQATYTFAYTDPASEASSSVAWAPYDQERELYWRCLVTEELLPLVSGLGFASSASPAGAAPVWPGEDGVTFGTGVPLAAGVVVEEVMDGIELNILSSDRQIPYVGAGTFKLYRSMGRVAFMSDDGYLEAWQPVPANQCVMVPKSMAQASGVVLSFYTGVAGLVTPWTRNV